MHKKIGSLSILVLLLLAPNVRALSWAYEFVVFDHKLYVVQVDATVDKMMIGDKIGEVKVEANDYSGDYYGDASNTYAKGTPYYEIIDTPISEAIAVAVDGSYKLAIYETDVPFKVQEVLMNPWFWAGVFTIIFLFVIYITRGVRLNEQGLSQNDNGNGEYSYGKKIE